LNVKQKRRENGSNGSEENIVSHTLGREREGRGPAFVSFHRKKKGGKGEFMAVTGVGPEQITQRKKKKTQRVIRWERAKNATNQQTLSDYKKGRINICTLLSGIRREHFIEENDNFRLSNVLGEEKSKEFSIRDHLKGGILCPVRGGDGCA